MGLPPDRSMGPSPDRSMALSPDRSMDLSLDHNMGLSWAPVPSLLPQSGILLPGPEGPGQAAPGPAAPEPDHVEAPSRALLLDPQHHRSHPLCSGDQSPLQARSGMVDGQSLKMIQSQWPDHALGVLSPGLSLGVLPPGVPSHRDIRQVLTGLVVLGDLHTVDPVLLRRAAVVSHLLQRDRTVIWRNGFKESSKAGIRLDVVCPVCATSMRAVESTSRNLAKILHCGHMLCMECCIRICANVDGRRSNPNGRKPQCPICKEPLGKYPNCGQSCLAPGRVGHPMPRNMDEMSKVPLTIPEGGANPSCCKICRIKRIERLSRKLVREIVNDQQAMVKWTPAVDAARQDERDCSNYVEVPELQKFLDVLADVVRDPEVYRKYTNLQPQKFSPPQSAKAIIPDRKREV
ncbi:hypothetical protein CGLO_13391 [Colletotrichum gloeosporioides Cg-14]|uniref:RING-type domain-containing protein n=1 Tax=Colletotrichum gloeosporioides (strain Cg-14) TaxID=1237896 RepID=T0K677_COLGC|nr:hypothetical protein CGLO_13391 [Colletotrichum gloeosporioides Cg-14]